VWSLFVMDDAPGDSGVIASGWTLNLTTIVPLPRPAILSGAVHNGVFQLTVSGQAGQSYAVQASSDLSSWTTIATTNAPATGVFSISENVAPGLSTRYYRTVRQ
jgi:hypothetical protein